jgi:hypothetical protein
MNLNCDKELELQLRCKLYIVAKWENNLTNVMQLQDFKSLNIADAIAVVAAN